MRISGLLLLIALCGNSISAHAQKIRTLNATRQSWSGGIAGRQGERYYFLLEFFECNATPLPDTLWIEQRYIVLTMKDSLHPDGNVKLLRSRNPLQFEIYARTIHDNPGLQSANVKNPIPPVPFKGVALLSYKYKGKKRYYEIGKIFKTYPPVNYP